MNKKIESDTFMPAFRVHVEFKGTRIPKFIFVYKNLILVSQYRKKHNNL